MPINNTALVDARVKLVLVLLLLLVLGTLLYGFYYLEQKEGISLSPPSLTDQRFYAFNEGYIACRTSDECPVEYTCDSEVNLCKIK